MIRELKEELERVKAELAQTLSNSGTSAASLLVLRGQIQENQAMLADLETPWEEKLKDSEAKLHDATLATASLQQALEQSEQEHMRLQSQLQHRLVQHFSASILFALISTFTFLFMFTQGLCRAAASR